MAISFPERLLKHAASVVMDWHPSPQDKGSGGNRIVATEGYSMLRVVIMFVRASVSQCLALLSYFNGHAKIAKICQDSPPI
jgi:hypothetical protein